jgi:hypothetical protein
LLTRELYVSEAGGRASDATRSRIELDLLGCELGAMEGSAELVATERATEAIVMGREMADEEDGKAAMWRELTHEMGAFRAWHEAVVQGLHEKLDDLQVDAQDMYWMRAQFDAQSSQLNHLRKASARARARIWGSPRAAGGTYEAQDLDESSSGSGVTSVAWRPPPVPAAHRRPPSPQDLRRSASQEAHVRRRPPRTHARTVSAPRLAIFHRRTSEVEPLPSSPRARAPAQPPSWSGGRRCKCAACENLAADGLLHGEERLSPYSDMKTTVDARHHYRGGVRSQADSWGSGWGLTSR